jgi:hypothetical protein
MCMNKKGASGNYLTLQTKPLKPTHPPQIVGESPILKPCLYNRMPTWMVLKKNTFNGKNRGLKKTGDSPVFFAVSGKNFRRADTISRG